jgi:16S rRNA (uracil1498-N3)-methyltransferase
LSEPGDGRLTSAAMSVPRFFVDAPLAAGETITLPEAVAHHALRVLRLPAEAPIVLFNGRGGEYPATLRAGRRAAQAVIEGFRAVERESPLPLTLVQSLIGADRLDWIVEKAVELGVARLLIAQTRRAVVRLDAQRRARRLAHWREIVRAACCQCGRNRLPAVDYCDSFDAALAALDADGSRLLLLPAAGAPMPAAVPGRRVALAVGPEGGYTDEEIEQARRAGFVEAKLGPRTLRADTAGLAALACLQSTGGDFGAEPRAIGSPQNRNS